MGKKLFYIFKILVIVLFISFSANFAKAYIPYLDDTVVPEKENIDVKNNLVVNSFTGAVTYTYPIILPPGTNGLQPSLSLSYNSQSVGVGQNIIGAGWSMTDNYIQRHSNYTPHITSDDRFILVLNGGQHDLVYNNNRYHTKIETFLHINNVSGGNNQYNDYWMVRTKDGTSYRFGYYNFSELNSNQNNYTFRWYLDLINDTYGNSIFYNYSENPFSRDQGITYLDSIRYNNDLQREIIFSYNLSNTHYLPFYQHGNRISQSKMLSEITIKVSNETMRRYVVSYQNLNANRSLQAIDTIIEYGQDDVHLPPVSFEYWSSNTLFYRVNWTHSGCKTGNLTGCFVGPNGEDYGTRLFDFNGDGLVDVIRATDNSGPKHYAWLNNGSGWEPTNWTHMGCKSAGDSNGCFTWGSVDNGVRIIDLNGDGLEDLFRALDIGGPGGTWAWINNGTGWENVTTWFWNACYGHSSSGCFTGSTGVDRGVRLLDLNGDGLVDIFKAQDAGSNALVGTWINNGNGFYAVNWTHMGCKSGNNSGCFVGPNGEDYGVRLIDLNLDGLMDIVSSSGYGPPASTPRTYAWLNNGSGWEPTNWTHMGCSNGENAGCFQWGSDNGPRIADLNGDGLVDLFRAFYGGSSSNTETRVWINNGTGWELVTSIWDGCNGSSNVGCIVDFNGGDRGGRVVDLNGDGFAEIFRGQDVGGNHMSATWFNNGWANHLMSNIELSLGGEISIQYQKSTLLNNKGNDTRSDLEFNLWLLSNLTKNNNIAGMHNLSSFTTYNFTGGSYDYRTREFRGFSLAEEKIEDKVVKHYFHQDVARNGNEYKTEILDNQTNPYESKERTFTYTQQNGYYIVKLSQETQIDYDGSYVSPKIKNATYDYDEFGNVVYKSINDISDPANAKFEYYSYLNGSQSWIVDKVKNYSLLASDNNTLLRNSLYSYDNLAFGIAPTKGDITRKQDWLKDGTSPVTLYSYNNFGNLVNFTDAKSNVTKYEYGFRDFTNTFPDNMTNSKNQLTSYFYDLKTGNLLAEKDLNGISKNYTYDELSIQKTVILPLDNVTFPTQEYAYNFTSPQGKIVVKQREQSGSLETADNYKFYDGFGRLIQIKTEAPNSKQIAVDIYYDKLGRIKTQTNPYLVTNSVDYSSPNTSVARTTYEYDVLDRIIKIINPDGTSKNITYDHWNIKIVDENGNEKNYTLNYNNKIIRIIEFNNGQEYHTRYDYNGADELIAIINAFNDTLNYSYDSLGRKVKLIDPDLGIWNYQYDNLGNLINQTDNRGKEILITYDSLNRKLKESSSSGNISYTYDVGKNNTLASVQTLEVVSNFSYDERSRKISEHKKIDNISFISNWSYDASDRKVSQTIPNGEFINFTYNVQGLISSIAAIGEFNHNEKNEITKINYNNSLSTNYSYLLTNFRLLEIKTANEQDLTYDYDYVGNILSIQDAKNLRNFSMSYDSLNRLIVASITDSNTITLNYLYDALGNMLNVTGDYNAEFYYEEGSSMHAPTQVIYY